MNQLTSKTRTQKILFTLLVLMFLIPVVSFAADEVTTIGGPANVIQGLLYTIVNSVFGWMAWASGLLLNYSVKEYVVGFGAGFRDSGLGFAVNNLWVTVRDIFNLTFIFGLVYIGFKMILNSGDSNARRMLVSLILAALLVNFSLFITKFVIDFSNIAATQFAAAFSSTSGAEVNYNLTEKFMQLTGLSSLWDSAKSVAAMPVGGGWAYIFGSLILYLVMAFVFFAGAILLIIRYIVLNIYMILSPIMFLGWVFPGFSGASQKYWDGFLQRAFFAPAYLLMLFFAAEVLKAMSIPKKSMADAFTGSNPTIATQSFVETIPYFILTCAFLIAAIVVAQKMGAVGATNAIAIGNRLRGTAQRAAGSATFGAAAVVGQRTIGYGAQKAANSDWLRNKAATSMLGSATLKASRAVGDKSFDGRNAFGLGKTLGVGDGGKGGYNTKVEAKNKKDADYAKSLGETKVDKDQNGKYTDKKHQERVDAGLKERENDINSNLYKKNQALNEARQNKLKGGDLAKAEAEIARAEKEQKKAFKETILQEEAKIQYEKQLAFINRRQQEANLMKGKIPGISGAVAGGGVGGQLGWSAFGAGVGAAAGTAAGAAMVHSVGAQNQESVNNLRKIYGMDGTVKNKSKEKEENLKILAAQIKESEGATPEKKPDEDK